MPTSKASLSLRLTQLTPRGIVPPCEIPGAKEYVSLRNKEFNVGYNAKKARECFFETFKADELIKYQQCIPLTESTGPETENEQLIDNINRWIDSCEWQYIESGTYGGSWVNVQYPDRIFSGASCSLPVSNGITETVEFPVESQEEDPLGLACHFESSLAGTKCTVRPNQWINYDSTRRGRLQARSNAQAAIRFKRWEAFDAANQIRDAMNRQHAIYTLKAKFLSENITKEHADMGYDM